VLYILRLLSQKLKFWESLYFLSFVNHSSKYHARRTFHCGILFSHGIIPAGKGEMDIP
jgi:hypothetical protein